MATECQNLYSAEYSAFIDREYDTFIDRYAIKDIIKENASSQYKYIIDLICKIFNVGRSSIKSFVSEDKYNYQFFVEGYDRIYMCFLSDSHYFLNNHRYSFNYHFNNGNYLKFDSHRYAFGGKWAVECNIEGRKMHMINGNHQFKNQLTIDDIDKVYDIFYRYNINFTNIPTMQFDPIASTLFFHLIESEMKEYDSGLEINKFSNKQFSIQHGKVIPIKINGRNGIIEYDDEHIMIKTLLRNTSVKSTFSRLRDYYHMSHTLDEIQKIKLEYPEATEIIDECISRIDINLWHVNLNCMFESKIGYDGVDHCKKIDSGVKEDKYDYVFKILTSDGEKKMEISTDVIIMQWGNGENKVTKVNCEQYTSDGTVVNNTTSYYSKQKKTEGFKLDPDGRFTPLVENSQNLYPNASGMIGYKLTKFRGFSVITVLDVPLTSRIDTGDHIKYRTNEAIVIDMFIPCNGLCNVCSKNTFLCNENNDFMCSQHMTGIARVNPYFYIPESYSALFNTGYKYSVDQVALPTSRDFKIRSQNCGIGIHFCKDIMLLLNYVKMRGDMVSMVQGAENVGHPLNFYYDYHVNKQSSRSKQDGHVYFAQNEKIHTDKILNTCDICNTEVRTSIALECGHNFHRLCLDFNRGKCPHCVMPVPHIVMPDPHNVTDVPRNKKGTKKCIIM